MKIIKMRYSSEPRDRIYVKGYGFLSFAKTMCTHATKVAKNVSNKYGQKLLDRAKKSTVDAIKTASKKAIQKTAEAIGDLIGNKIANKITNVSTKKAAKNDDANNETEVGRASSKDVNVDSPKEVSVASPKDVPKKYTYLQKKSKKLLMN